MGKELCVLHANCQGDALKELLEASPDFSAKFEIRHLRNYEKQALDQGLLDASRLFLHQYLVPRWGPLSTDEVLPRLSPASTAICVPNTFFNGYWPLALHHKDMHEYGDKLLEALLEKGLSDQEVLRIYLKGAPSLFGDVENIAASSLEREKEKEKHTPVKYVDFLEERWRDQQLFLTVSHPAPVLLVHIAQEILRLLELAPIPETFAQNYVHPHNEFWHPIHPTVGALLGVPFASRERKYPCFGAELTHAEFTLVYLSCRRNNFADLPSALASHAAKLHAASS